ncbi:MAG: flagellar motor switch protein FliG [Gammaproteobacteria bacterium]|nr:flagellar motor switch protein FliG [Gammaproteobacteria bacterium]
MAVDQALMASRSGVEKAAILLLTLGEKEAAEVLRHLPAKEVQRLGAAMAQISDVSRSEVTEVLGWFMDDAERQTSLGLGSADFVRKTLIEAMGEHQAAGLLDQILLGRASKGLESLKWMDPKAIAEMVRQEHPQIVAIILAYLEAEQSAKIVAYLPEEVRGDLLFRVATLDGIQPAALQELDQVMERQFAGSSRTQAPGFGGPKVVADIVNLLDARIETRVMQEINTADEALGAKIQDLVFVFDDLIEIDDRSMQELLRQVPSDQLLLALKATEDGLRDKIFRNMSQRAAETLKEDLEARGPVRLSEVESARKEILALARRLAEEGAITLGARGGEAFV